MSQKEYASPKKGTQIWGEKNTFYAWQFLEFRRYLLKDYHYFGKSVIRDTGNSHWVPVWF